MDNESGGQEEDEVAPGTSAESRRRRMLATKPSDLELYERRTSYSFPQDSGLSVHLPTQRTPEEQVAAASVYELFRFVRFHGGRYPHLSWHEPFDMPIITMSPVVKLREGPDFALGARWALVQYHAWKDRRDFLDMDDELVKHTFRAWVQGPDAPWYVREQYCSENNRRLRGVGSGSKRESKHVEFMSEEVYTEKLKQLVDAEDFVGAAALLQNAYKKLPAADKKNGPSALCAPLT